MSVSAGSRAELTRGSLANRVTLVVVTVLLLLPVVWLFATAYKAPVDIFSVPPRLTFSPTLANFRGLFELFDVTGLVVSTLVIALGSAALALLIGVPAGYALARLDTGWAEALAYLFLAVRMVPPVAVLIPYYLLARDLGLLGTWWAVIVIDAMQSGAFVVWMMYGTFRSIPRDVEQAALTDGCTQAGAFLRAALPVARPGIIASALFSIIFAWNGFLFPAFLTSSSTKPLSVALISAFGSTDITWGTMGALAHFSTLPIVVLALVLNRFFVHGMTRGVH